MCGICGMFNQTNPTRPERAVLENMLQAIRHRGPDGTESLLLDNVALGFNRLSFIDLEGGMQPIQNEDGTLSMICNGEVFNFSELRKELEEKGHQFRTKTDVEVVLHLYEEEGLDGYANWYEIQAQEERDHALIFRNYLHLPPLLYCPRRTAPLCLGDQGHSGISRSAPKA